MTANVRVVTSVLDDVLKVPNSALRFRPPQKSDEKSDKKTERTKSGQKEGSANGSGRSKREPGVAKLYRVENNELKEITVKTGASDGKMTEITGEGVAEGVEVVTGVKGGDSGRGRSSSSGMGNAPRVF